MPKVAKSFNEILKFNPYHDARGRFATANGATSFTLATRDPNKQYLADMAIARARENSPDYKRKQTINNVEDKIRHQNFESAALVDKDGNQMFFKDGQKSQVGFTQDECNMMKGAILTHNHPSGTMFSAEDINCFAANRMHEIRATTTNGTTYTLKQGDTNSPLNGESFSRDYSTRRRAAIMYAQNDLDSRGFREKIFRGEITPEHANKEMDRVITSQMIQFCNKEAKGYGMTFSVERRDVKKGHEMKNEITKSDENHVFVLDKETNEADERAFNEWLERARIDEIEEV